jgi:hypothetical protein
MVNMWLLIPKELQPRDLAEDGILNGYVLCYFLRLLGITEFTLSIVKAKYMKLASMSSMYSVALAGYK